MPDPVSILEYHERSKHRLARYAPGPGHLDWASQPNPFRTYSGAPRVALALGADRVTTRFADLRAGRLPAPLPLNAETIAILLELSLAISAWKAYGRSRWALRCNPSSGNLHPTEGYVVTADVPGIAAGIYHYVSRDHTLERRAAFPAAAPVASTGILVGLASIYWREAWKYGMRAFRYCQHDCGHAVAAVSYAAAALGWQTRLLDSAADEDVAALLGLDRHTGEDELEREEPDCLLWVGQGEAPTLEALVDAARELRWFGIPNQLSLTHRHWPDIDHAHEATRKPRTAPAARQHPQSVPEPPTSVHDLSAATLYRRRRSAVDFDGITSISEAAFYAMLEPLLPRAGTPPWNAWPDAARVHLAMFVHRVEGLAPGLYFLPRNPSHLTAVQQAMRPEWRWRKVGPTHLPLHLLLPHDLRAVARQISCHQDIAADSCFSLGMLASFEGVEHAPWLYRRLYWECGIVGQALYLEAEAAGIRGTGIGCFFDDEMHELLGLEGQAWQSLYHFTAGGPVDDARLTTLAPYGEAAAS
jgi:SagB-type dehydrogenase family enzyme